MPQIFDEAPKQLQQAPTPQSGKPSEKPRLTRRQQKRRNALHAVLWAALVVGVLAAVSTRSTRMRSSLNDARLAAVVRWNTRFNPAQAYQATAASINKKIRGAARYSVMHNHAAGVTVIFNVPEYQAKQLSDPTFDFSTSPRFRVTDGAYKDIGQLANSYAVTVPRKSVAGVIARVDVTAADTLKTVLSGLQVAQVGPGQSSGTFLIYGDDQALIKRLRGGIRGRLQTISTFPGAQYELTIPIDKSQKMDVTRGR